ncbi:Potassium transporter, partial [Cryomyces antarcticus]
MGCGDDREEGKVLEEQKWDYITLSDFKSTSCWEGFSYGWLWFMAIVSIAVYGADTFTAVNLLVFNKWSSQIQPAIKFDVSKWIFAVCIILSWALCAYERFRAIRVIRRGGVAESFLDPLA